MTTHNKSPAVNSRPALLLAEYKEPKAAMQAAELLRDGGYRNFDVHTPYPVHGMDKAMGLRDSKIGWIVLVMGLSGLIGAASMIWWMNGIDYPLIIGGKPPKSIPSMVPVMFELTVLFSAFGAILGMLFLNRLPRHHHPIFNSDRFARFSNDTFFVSVEGTDPKFNLHQTQALLQRAHATHIESVYDEGP